MAVAPVGGSTDFWKMETSTTAGGTGTNPWAAVARASNTNIVLADGDLLWAQVGWNAGEAPNMASPAGWTVVTGYPFTQGTVGTLLAYRVVSSAAGEAATYTWQPKATDGTTNQAARGSVGIRVYRGVDTATPLDVAPSRTNGVSSATAGTAFTAAAVTTATANAYLLSGATVDSSQLTTGITSPGGTTKIWDLVARRQAMAEKGAQAAAGSSGALSWSVSIASLDYVTYQAALRPGAGLAADVGWVYDYAVRVGLA